MYAVNIPALEPTQDGSVVHVLASQINAGTPLNLSDIEHAQQDYRARKKLKTSNVDAPVVTSAEVARAAIRVHAVIAAHASVMYPGVGVPGSIANALQAAFQPLRDQLVQVENRLNQVEYRLGQMENQLIQVESRSMARLTNSQQMQDEGSLVPVVAADGQAPPNFPATVGDLRFLEEEGVDALLGAYGLDKKDNLSARRTQLGNFLGLCRRV
ncbi:Aste57867_8443 [Aphanomyces stellatus]|uniref:Aste57867_8443 protein n=1 Tax=Aphanomyces stellatus TaxID=120398 RepID=A0A485KK99_9STRA|nr:hypothetical protein As57867_008411 [Aphanomyces stellatus]VFT85329.1 Aste57867_8443 [Aphanomyces stellatus]